MVAKKFQIHDVKTTGKYICESKNCTHTTQAKLSPRFLSLLPRPKKITHFLRKVFFENLLPPPPHPHPSPPSKKRGGLIS